MAKVIVLNGAPGAGKDTLASALGIAHLQIKAPLFKIARSMLGGRLFNAFMHLYNNRNSKEMPVEFLGWRSPRKFMIWISEEVMKPAFGNDVFGRFAVEAVDASCSDCVFSDGGFRDEVKALANAGHDVHLIRLHAEWATFEGDSRSHLYDIDGVIEHDLTLTWGDVDGAVSAIKEMVCL